MKLAQIAGAYAALTQMMDMEFDYASAHALVILKNKLRPHVDFFSSEEMRLAETYGKKDAGGKVVIKENGNFDIACPDGMVSYLSRRDELFNTEVEPDWTVPRVRRPERIRPAHLEALEGFVEFDGPEG